MSGKSDPNKWELEIERLRTDKESLMVGRDYLLSEIEKLKSERDAAELMSLALRADLAECRKDADRMRMIGTRLSNVAFNLAQRCGDPLTGDDVALLDGLRKQWDAAVLRRGVDVR